MKTLKISDALDLPLQSDRSAPGAITQKFAFLGRTGSGKTYGATKLAELMLEAEAQIIALDPVGVWPFLRLGDRPFSLPVLGGLYGDVPLEPTGGALVADFLVDTGSSAVLDVSQMIDAEQLRFATGFATRFFDRKKAAPSAVHLFVEEAQEFIPQNIEGRGGGVAHAINAFNRIVKIGRNFGIGVSLITQRPQEVSKKALNQTECLFAFQMTGVQERKAIAAWCADKGLDVDLVDALPRLAVGHAYAWSPQWLGVAKEIRIAKKRTADGSSAPTMASAGSAGKAMRLSPVDLPALRERMSETVERAKRDDPAELRKQLAAKDRRIAELEKAKPKEAPPRVQLVPKFDKPSFDSLFEQILEQCGNVAKAGQDARSEIGAALNRYAKAVQSAAGAGEQGVSRMMVDPPRPNPAVRPDPPPRSAAHRDPKPGNGAVSLDRAARRILTALAQHGPLSLTQAAIIAEYAPDSGNTRNAAGALRSAGFVEGQNARLEATTEGIAWLGPFDPLPEGSELAEHWLGKLEKAEREILRVVLAAYPAGVPLTFAASQAGYAPDSGNVRNAAGRLRTLDLVRGGNAMMTANERLVG